MNFRFLEPFSGKQSEVPPCWFMRQAGRYLPEYRALREEAGGFLAMCYTPDLATEITLQPIRRFGMDAAIIFSDILVVPQGLGRPLEFITGQGPWLEPLTHADELAPLSVDAMREFLAPVYQALRQTRAALPDDTALIGFAGAPWTLLCYMFDGNGKKDFIETRSAIYSNPALVGAAMALLTDAVSEHLIAQIDAGAQAVQLFDSWASHVPWALREPLIYKPSRAIVARVKAAHPDVPVLCFPRAIGARDMVHFARHVQPDGLSVDQFTDIIALRGVIDETITLQGNVDPLALIHDIDGLCAHVATIRRGLAGSRFVMNLGHGVLPPTPPEHMARLVDAVRAPLPALTQTEEAI